jgi:hypothetical protein
MAKQKNHNGKMSHCTNNKSRDLVLIKLWERKLKERKGSTNGIEKK